MMGHGRRQKGAALVEFALVLPLLCLFLFGIVQFGIVYDKQQSINSAAREGARHGALDETTLEDIALQAVATSDASAVPGEAPLVEVSSREGGTVTLVATRDSDGNYADAGGSAIDEDDETLMPCGVIPPEDRADAAVVRVSTPYEITIPMWGVSDVTISTEAEFRCE